MTKKMELLITPVVTIPDHLTGQIRSKMGYLDELVAGAVVTEDQIILTLSQTPDDARKALIEEKVQRVVEDMARGALKPKIEILEDFSDRPVYFNEDPMDELLRTGEVFEEETGVYIFGSLMTGLMNFFQSRFSMLADHFEAKAVPFPNPDLGQDVESGKLFQFVPTFALFRHASA